MRMFLISDNRDTCTGMRLAGVEGVVVHEKQEFKDVVDKVTAEKDMDCPDHRIFRPEVSGACGGSQDEPASALP